MSAWRVIITDSESMTGVAPVCEQQDRIDGPHARDDFTEKTLTEWVFDCCPHPQIECWSESTAENIARQLTMAEAEVCS